LKTYLELTEWMREYVSNYVTVSQSLQDRKTLLLKSSSISESIRRKFFFFTRIFDLTEVERNVFFVIQIALSKSRFRVHFDNVKQLYEDVDASKEFEIEMMIYHVKNDEKNLSAYSSRSKVESILFLSRQLKTVERNYWFTELEVVDIVFTIRKIRHMIEFFRKSIILFTDHESALDIIKQTSLLTTFTDRLNLRLIRAFEYIQRFNVILKHKPEKQHIVSNALSRLKSENDENAFDSRELNALIVTQSSLNIIELNALFIIILMKMNSDFRIKIIHEYFTNSRWKKIQKTLKTNNSSLSFELNNNLIYRTNHIALKHAYESRRLCISINTISNILKLAHSDTHHSEFAKCFDIIFFSWYIHELIKHLRQYLRHCSQCQIFQTRRHKSYDSLQSILISKVLFHILTMNFILILLVFDSNNFDSIMFVICKFFKRITLISNKIIWKFKDWTAELLTRLKLMNWKLSKTIISNRDVKFLSKLWQIWFNKLSVKLLYFTVYHSQSDDQSKRTNQTIEIALRYHLVVMKNSRKWSHCLSILQSQLNNITIAMSKISNEIVYEFISIQSADLSASKSLSTFDSAHVRKEIADALAWTQLQMKNHYDRKHQSLNLKIEDFVLLRLHKGYNISITKVLSRKLFDQYIEFFRILKKIDNLAYRLDLSHHWKIHSVISVAQLKSISDSVIDSFKRSRSDESELVHMKEDIDNVKSFELKKLINKRTTIRDVKYLVRWKRYDSQHDEWRSLLELQNALDLINDYETFMKNIITLFDRISRSLNVINNNKFIQKQIEIRSFESIMKISSIFVIIISLDDILHNITTQSMTSSHNFSSIMIRRSSRKRKSRERD
jgi:hypothetical protein